MAVPFLAPSHARDLGSVAVAAAFESGSIQGIARGPWRARDVVRPEVVAGVEQAPAPEPEPPAAPTPEPPPMPLSPRVVLALPPDPPTSGGGLAPGAGPGFYRHPPPSRAPYT